MLSVTLITVGKLKDVFFQQAADEYLKRLKAYAKMNTVEIKQINLPENPSESEIKNALNKEGEEILKKIPQNALVAALCIEGKMYSSEDMAEMLKTSAVNGTSHIVFIIGGSYGLSEDIKKRADIKLSMSKMTFPHRLARIMLLEQIYRGFTIINNKTYHK